MPIRCEIVSQDRAVYSDDVDIVVVPGAEGMMGILPNHAPLLSVLQYGIVTVRKQGQEEHFTVAGGVVEVQPDQVTILADAAENVAEIDEQRAQAAKQRAEEALKNRGQTGESQRDEDFLAIQASLRRSGLRLDAINRYKRGRSTPRGQ